VPDDTNVPQRAVRLTVYSCENTKVNGLKPWKWKFDIRYQMQHDGNIFNV